MRFVSYMTPGFPRSLFEIIAEVLQAELHIEEHLSGPAPDHDPFRDGTFDLGWICSTSFVDLRLRAADPSVRLAGVAWVPDDPDVDGRPVYFGDILVPADSPVTDLDHLAGKRIGCNDPVSLSGHHALRFEIERRGSDPERFAELVFTGGHHASLDALLEGALDAVVVDSVVRVGRGRVDPAVAALRVVDRLGPWPVQPLVAGSAVDDDTVADLARRLIHAGNEPPMQAELRAAALTGLVAVEADHYAPVHDAMRRSDAIAQNRRHRNDRHRGRG